MRGELDARDPVDPLDRNVFAVIELKPLAIFEQTAREEYFLTLPGSTTTTTLVQPQPTKLEEHPFRHDVFRRVHVELELLRNEVVRFQIFVTVDVEAFNDNDLSNADDVVNVADGVMTFVIELRRNPAPGDGQPEYSWELAVLADRNDVDGLAATEDADVLDYLGGPLLSLPPITALSGGRVGWTGFLIAAGIGTLLQQLDVITVRRMVWQGIRGRIEHGNIDSVTLGLAIDYTLQYELDLDLEELLGIPLKISTPEPMTVTFRNLGFEIVDLSTFVFLYEPDDGFEIVVRDPGVFRGGDILGELGIEVETFRVGAGLSMVDGARAPVRTRHGRVQHRYVEATARDRHAEGPGRRAHANDRRNRHRGLRHHLGTRSARRWPCPA